MVITFILSTVLLHSTAERERKLTKNSEKIIYIKQEIYIYHFRKRTRNEGK